MSTRERINMFLEDGTALLLEPEVFDAAIIGVADRAGQPTLVAYDRTRCIEILMEQGISRDEAEEYYEFNIACAWFGDGTPVFIDTRWAE